MSSPTAGTSASGGGGGKRRVPTSVKRCPAVGCSFTAIRHNTLRNHIERYHLCRDCGNLFYELSDHDCPLEGQRTTDQGPTELNLGDFIEVASAHLGYIKLYRFLVPPNTIFDRIDEFYNHLDDRLMNFITQLVLHFNGIRLTLTLYIHLVNLKNNDEMYTNIAGESFTVCTPNQVEHAIVHNAVHQIYTLNSFTTRGSLWNLNQILRLDLNIGKYNPLLVGARQFKIPAFLRNKKGIIVLKSPPDECFSYAITCARFYRQIPIRFRKTAKYYEPFLCAFDWSGIPTPTPVEKVHLFEKRNDLAVNIHFLQNSKIYPLIMSKKENVPHVDLLVISKRKDAVAHYAIIYNLHRFLGACRINRVDRRLRYYCRNCYNKFGTVQLLEKHQQRCMVMKPQIVKYPSPSNMYNCFDRFKKFGYCQQMSYVGCFDFECFLTPHSNANDPTITHIHDPSSFCLIVWGPDQSIFRHHIYNGPNPVQEFFRVANDIAEEVLQLIKVNNARAMTDEEEERFNATNRCNLCERPFRGRRVKVRHHNHTRWFYRTNAQTQQQFRTNFIDCICNFCNLQIKVRRVQASNLTLCSQKHSHLQILAHTQEKKMLTLLAHNGSR